MVYLMYADSSVGGIFINLYSICNYSATERHLVLLSSHKLTVYSHLRQKIDILFHFIFSHGTRKTSLTPLVNARL